jgi:hypothetical protein
MRSMEDEHCEIEPGDVESVAWGASDRLWTTGNYGLTTTPRKEWHWTVHLEWDGVRVEQTVGGYEKDGGWDGAWSGRENTSVRREAVAMDTLAADAPRLIFAMLHELLAKRGPSGTLYTRSRPDGLDRCPPDMPHRARWRPRRGRSALGRRLSMMIRCRYSQLDSTRQVWRNQEPRSGP